MMRFTSNAWFSPIRKRASGLSICGAIVLLLAVWNASGSPPVKYLADVFEDFFTYSLHGDTVVQTAPIGALMAGIYDGDISFGELKKHGNYGIGTVNELDGEMIALDGIFYQIRSDGHVYLLKDDDKTPFAAVTFFQPEVTYFDSDGMTLDELHAALHDMNPTRNFIYAFKIEGSFSYVKTRSVARQEKPYVRLTEAAKDQKFFEMNSVEGTIFGYWMPSYLEGAGVPGFHFHFITKDRQAGGHLIDCVVEKVDVEIDYKYGFNMALPSSMEFYNADLSTEGLDEVEKPKSSLRFFEQFR